MVKITVLGQGRERADAERASVTVTSRHESESSEESMAVAAEAHAAVIAAAQGFSDSGAAAQWHADRVWVSHHEEWVGDNVPRRLVFSAAATVRVTFVDTEALGQWIGQLGSLPVYQVGDLQWTLSADTAAALGARAREAAVRDAMGKAQELAAAAGLSDPVLLELREVAAGRPELGAGTVAASMDAHSFSAKRESSIALAASEIEVSADLVAQFEV